jgi:hypothetical protein
MYSLLLLFLGEGVAVLFFFLFVGWFSCVLVVFSERLERLRAFGFNAGP